MTFAPFAGVRVVEIGDQTGQFCGRLLRDLGADVVKVEPPGGVASRTLKDRSGEIESTAFAYYNAGKRSIVLDITSTNDQALLERLLASADVLIESLSWHEHLRWGLTRERLTRAFPGLITASISGFGRTGPHATWEWTDLIAMAASGLLNLCGVPESPPVTAPNDQAFHIGSLHAAVAVAAALCAPREERGCYIDISLQECLAIQEQHVGRFLDDGHVVQREGSQHGSAVPGRIYGCADGSVYIAVGIGPEGWDDLMTWLEQPPLLADGIWRDPGFRRENHDVVDLVVQQFASHKLRDWLVQTGQAGGVRVLPVLRPSEFVDNEQVQARDLFPSDENASPWLRPPYLFDGQPLAVQRTAPRLNADRRRVEREWLRTPSPPGRPRTRPIDKALAGVRVVEFGFLIAGPMVARLLLDYGAEVIKVETRTRPDTMRNQPRNFLEMNRGKRSLTLNMKTAEGPELARRLLAASDAVVENMNANVMRSWGLGYDDLQSINRGIIQLDMPGLGSTGPWRDFTSLGAALMALTGFSWLWNHPGTQPPVGCQLSYPDYVGGLHGALAIIACLRERETTGRGRHIELAQYEAAAAVLGPVYLDGLRGASDIQVGNRTPHNPGGLYPCLGEDQWIAIETRNGDDWRRLCRVRGDDETGIDPHLASVRGRFTFRRELDAWMEAWTRTQDKTALAAALQAAGVPAAPVANAADLVRDEQLSARGFLAWAESWQGRRYELPGNPEVIDGSRLSFAGHTMGLGEQTPDIAAGVLGLAPDEITRLQEAGVLQ